MQPYLFPYIGYFQLINYTDKWVIFDDIQYIRKGWVNRNRLIHPTKPESQFFTVPVLKSDLNTDIGKIKIDCEKDFRNDILTKIDVCYKKRAPYFKEVRSLIDECLIHKTENICELNIFAMSKVCDYLGIDFDYVLSSELDYNRSEIDNAGDWAYVVSKYLKADEYVNPPGGMELFDVEKFNLAGVDIKFMKANLPIYNQKKACFIEGLSIIDIMMFNDVENIRKMLENYEFVY